METPNPGCWSELPTDILRSVFERISFADFHRSKIVCQNWYLCSKQTLPRKTRSLWLMLFRKDDDSCALYNPNEARVYKSKRDLSGIQFLANSGNMFLVVDSKLNLYIIDLFSEKRINLPPLKSINGHNFERKKDNKFKETLTYGQTFYLKNIQTRENLRGLLWVDEKKDEYVVVWYFKYFSKYIGFCKNGEDHYSYFPLQRELPFKSYIDHMVLWGGDNLYITMRASYFSFLEFSRKDAKVKFIMRWPYSLHDKNTKYIKRFNNYYVAVTTSGEVLFVHSILYDDTSRSFRIYKKDPTPGIGSEVFTKPNQIVEIDSLSDEALLLDLGITVPADLTVGIEPNSIYFTCDDHVCNLYQKPSTSEICVFNLVTNTHKRFPDLSNLKLRDVK